MSRLHIQLHIPILALLGLALLIGSVSLARAGHEYIPPGYYFDNIIIKTVKDLEEAALEISGGSMHVYIDPIGYKEYIYLSTKYPRLGFARVDLEDIYMIINPRIDKPIRQALSQAIDRDKLNSELFQENGKPFIIPLPEINPFTGILRETYFRKSYGPYNVKNISLLYYSDQPYLGEVAEYIARSLRSVGIEVNIYSIEDPVKSGNISWDIMLVGVDAYNIAEDFLKRILAIYISKLLPPNLIESKGFRGVKDCWEDIYMNPHDLLNKISQCIGLSLDESIVVGLITVPGFQIYNKDALENLVIDPELGLLNYLFFRVTKLREYPIWGGTLVIGVNSVSYIINPLITWGTVNRVLRLTIYDLPTFPDPYTKLPIYDQVIPIPLGEALFDEVLGPYKPCYWSDLQALKDRVNTTTLNASIKLHPYHDGSTPSQLDFDGWRSLAEKLHNVQSVIKELLNALKTNASIVNASMVVKTIIAGNMTIREYISAPTIYTLTSNIPARGSCYAMQKYIYFPLHPWEVSILVEKFYEENKRLPDLVRDASKLKELALNIGGDMKNGIKDIDRIGNIVKWIDNTSTALIGNGPYYVKGALLGNNNSLKEIVLGAYRHEKTYWGSTGDLEVITYLYSWRVLNVTISPEGKDLHVCVKIAGDSELTRVLIGNGLLNTDIALFAGNKILVLSPSGRESRCATLDIKDMASISGIYEGSIRIRLWPLSFYPNLYEINMTVAQARDTYTDIASPPPSMDSFYIVLGGSLLAILSAVIVAMRLKGRYRRG